MQTSHSKYYTSHFTKAKLTKAFKRRLKKRFNCYGVTVALCLHFSDKKTLFSKRTLRKASYHICRHEEHFQEAVIKQPSCSLFWNELGDLSGEGVPGPTKGFVCNSPQHSIAAEPWKESNTAKACMQCVLYASMYSRFT